MTIVTYLLAEMAIWKFPPYSDLLGSYCNKEKEPKKVEQQQLKIIHYNLLKRRSFTIP